MSRVLLIGEVNPLSLDPKYALYPWPEGCSGHRLATNIFGMREEAYLEIFDRSNLCIGQWCDLTAQITAGAIRAERVILLGAKVGRAFGVKAYMPMRILALGTGMRALVLPHPSRLSRAWYDPEAIITARELVRAFVPEAADLIGGN